MSYKETRNELLQELRLKKGASIMKISNLSADIENMIRFSHNQLAWIQNYMLQTQKNIDRHLKLDSDFDRVKIKNPTAYTLGAHARAKAYAYIFVLSTNFKFFKVVYSGIDYEDQLQKIR